MKPFYENLFTIDEAEGPNQSLPDFHLISIQVKFLPDFFETTRTLPSLFDFGDFSFDSHWHHGWHRFEVDHDDTLEHLGRAYYSSCNYQITEFSFTLYSVDELKRQIEAKMQQFEEHRDVMVPCLIKELPAPSTLDFYFAENGWNGDLCAWIEDFQTRNRITRNAWMADDHHSCRPFEDKSFYLHQLAKLSLSGAHPQARTAARPCCRSFLMASCRQSLGDDLLGH